MSDSVRPHRRKPTRLPRPWDSPGKNTGVGCHFLLQCMKVKSEREVAQSCQTLSDPMDCSPPGSSIHGIFQARVLASWVRIKPAPPALEGEVLTTGLPGKSLNKPFLNPMSPHPSATAYFSGSSFSKTKKPVQTSLLKLLFFSFLLNSLELGYWCISPHHFAKLQWLIPNDLLMSSISNIWRRQFLLETPSYGLQDTHMLWFSSCLTGLSILFSELSHLPNSPGLSP